MENWKYVHMETIEKVMRQKEGDHHVPLPLAHLNSDPSIWWKGKKIMASETKCRGFEVKMKMTDAVEAYKSFL
jgi:hypothetical protein